MWKKIFKGIVIGLSIVIALLAIVSGVLFMRSQSRFNHVHAVQAEAIAVPTDAASLERGKHLAGMLCTGCHGDNLAGTEFFNDPTLGTIHAKNLTAGTGQSH